eukprot:gb/GECH01007061.1/.p1 GENE.gb/GECH01007061.1/~~gb/GECH01007061.1/.p1  ORF type:complete len:328 (+),score=74.83 gb/GECH01007061.1/:1-984(+)
MNSSTQIMIAVVLAMMAFFIPLSQAQDQNVVATLENEGYTTLVSLIDQAGLNSTLASTTLTIFAPSNDALANLGSVSESELQSLLSYHVIPNSEVASSDLSNNQTPTTFDDDKKLRINIYGSTVTVNGITVTNPDIQASNGIIHGISGALSPVDEDITTKVVASDNLSTLETALTTANLTKPFQGGWEASTLYTVFAPSNSAFGDLPDGALQDLLDNPQQLSSVLTYHVVEGVFFSAGLSDGITVTTLQGEEVTISISGSTVMVNDATVTQADVTAENGVVHIIDEVLMPGSSESSGSDSGNDDSSDASTTSMSLMAAVIMIIVALF